MIVYPIKSPPLEALRILRGSREFPAGIGYPASGEYFRAVRILGLLLTASLLFQGCTAIRTTPRLDHDLDSSAERYASGATQTFWTELIPTPRYHSKVGMLTLGILPTGRQEFTKESIFGWFAWCWWFSSEWEMGSLFGERSPQEARMKTTLLRKMAEAGQSSLTR